VRRLEKPPAKILPTARTPKTIAFAAFEVPGLTPPPAPMPFKALNIPGHVKAVIATQKAEKIDERYQRTWCFSSWADISLRLG
jgi:hypothetical protein